MSIAGTSADCTILVDGKQLTYDVSNIELDQYIDKHHELKVKIRDVGVVSAAEDIEDPTPYMDFLGKSISVKIKPTGHDVDEKLEMEFVGVVTGVNIINGVNGINIYEIQASSPTIGLDGAKVNSFHFDQSASDIISSIVGSYPMTVGNVDSTPGTYKYSVQYHETDYEYVMRLATAKGLFAFYDGKEFRAVKASSSDVVNLAWRNTLRSFNFNLGTAPYNFSAAVFNYTQSKTFSSDSKSLRSDSALSDTSNKAPEASKKVYSKSSAKIISSVEATGDLDNILKQEKQNAIGRMIKCTGESIVPKVAVGHCVHVKGMGKIDGDYWVTTVRHRFDEAGQYYNEFDSVPLDTAAPTYPIKRKTGTMLQTAIVVDNNDPEGLGRVKVKYPWLDSEESDWVRVGTPHAGGGRGWISTPEIDDEVLVGFEHGNPDEPVIINSLYNKDSAPHPDHKDDKNNIKLFATRGGNGLIINDTDGSQSITIAQGDNSIVLTLDGPKISIESSGGDISFKSNNFKIEADSKIEIKAGSDLKLEGSANAEYKAGAENKISGAKVTVSGNPIALN